MEVHNTTSANFVFLFHANPYLEPIMHAFSIGQASQINGSFRPKGRNLAGREEIKLV